MGEDIITHAERRTLHRGTVEDGSECHVTTDEWAVIDAEDPVEAVINYGCIPCKKCFDHTTNLLALYDMYHTATVVGLDEQKLIDRTPWSVNETRSG